MGWQPSLKKLERFQVRHGLGYSSFETENQGISLGATVFVPLTDPCEVWELRIFNTTKQKRRLSLFFLAEWAAIFSSASYRPALLLAESWKQPSLQAFLACDHPIDSFDTDAQTFFGQARSYAQPQALLDGRCSRTAGQFASLPGLAVIQKNLTLGSEATQTLGLTLGYSDGRKNSERKMADRYSVPHQRLEALNNIQTHWQQRSERHVLNSPQEPLNKFYKHWLSYQAIQAGRLAANRQPSSTTLLAQHLIGLLAEEPLAARENLDKLLTQTLKDGRVAESRQGSAGHYQTSFTSAFWFVLAIATYLKETGEKELLQKDYPYADGGSGTVLEHIIKVVKQLGESLNAQHLVAMEQKVSILQSCQFQYLLSEITPIFELKNEDHLVASCQELQKKISRAVLTHGWENGWFLRERGAERIGSPRQKCHRLDLETQIWAILAKIPDEKRAINLLSEVKKQLSTKVGYENLTPSYPAYQANRAEFSQHLPGQGCNGGIDSFLTILLARSQAASGLGGEALKTLELLLPQNNGAATPFFLPTEHSGRAAAKFGVGRVDPVSPAASWWNKVLLENILGIEAVLGGLKINPRLPKSWRQVEVNRVFRGAEYHFRLQNTFGGGHGVDRLIVDGERITGQVIAPFRSGSHFVEVILS